MSETTSYYTDEHGKVQSVTALRNENARLRAAAQAVLDRYTYQKQGGYGSLYTGPLPEQERQQLIAALRPAGESETKLDTPL